MTSHKFDCLCTTCSLPLDLSQQSDHRRRLISEWDSKHVSYEDWANNKSIPRMQFIEDRKELLELIETEGLYNSAGPHLVSMAVGYYSLGKRDEFEKWTDRARKEYLEQEPIGDQFREWLDHPEKYFKWSARKYS
jgi:hypothetical protein